MRKNKDENFLSPEPGEWGFTYLQVVSAFSGAKQVATSDIIKCAFIPFSGLQIKRAILSTCLSMVARPINTATFLSLVCPYSMFCFADQCLSSQPNFQLRVMYQRVCLSYERRWFLEIIKSV